MVNLKRIREINGQKVALIEKDDVRTLLVSRSFIRPELFMEPALVNLESDEQGFYPITEPANVAYIESLGFIVDYDALSSLSLEELDSLATKAMEDDNKIRDIVVKLCEFKEKLKFKERRLLKKSEIVDPYCRNCIEENVLHASGERMRFREMEEALLAQLRNHTNAIGRMAESRHFEKKYGKRKAN